MDINKDYYQTLGITPSAELAVIKAVYKALANKYHPDKHTGNKAQAEAKMREINEAYEVLSDSTKRSAYDSARNKADEAAFEETDESFKNAEDTLSEIIKSDWQIAEKYHSEAKSSVGKLAKISRSLILPFKIYVLEGHLFANANEIAEEMIDQYLQRYFSKSFELRAFARRLLDDGDRAAAKELNRVVRVLGKTIVPKNLIFAIDQDFQTKQWRQAKADYEEAERVRQTEILKRQHAEREELKKRERERQEELIKREREQREEIEKREQGLKDFSEKLDAFKKEENTRKELSKKRWIKLLCLAFGIRSRKKEGDGSATETLYVSPLLISSYLLVYILLKVLLFKV